MTEFSQGGVISGPPLRLIVRPAGLCKRGHALVSIDGDPPEHIITAAEVQVRDQSKVDCQRRLEEEQAMGGSDD